MDYGFKYIMSILKGMKTVGIKKLIKCRKVTLILEHKNEIKARKLKRKLHISTIPTYCNYEAYNFAKL